MANDNFSRRDVERAFRTFKDLVSDLARAETFVWEDTFKRLIHHCENNPVMRVVTSPLRDDNTIDLNKWLTKDDSEKWGFIARYRLPDDEDERTGLLYQFFLKLCADKGDFYDALFQFAMHAYGKTNVDEVVAAIYSELVSKFARTVSYRLDEIIHDIGDQQEVPREAMMVFHFHDHSRHDHSLNIHGIQGSNVAINESSVSNATSAYTSNLELVDALKALKPLVREVAANQKNAVQDALEVLIHSAENNASSGDEVSKALEAVANSSPTIRDRLKGIAGRIGISLASSTIFQALKTFFGLP